VPSNIVGTEQLMNSSKCLADSISCCVGFSNLLASQDAEGFSIVAVIVSNQRYFYLRACPLPPITIAEIQAISDPFSELINSLSSIGSRISNIKLDLYQIIAFCPFCGRNLRELIESNTVVFDEIAKNCSIQITPNENTKR
jgi:hypothetical protein